LSHLKCPWLYVEVPLSGKQDHLTDVRQIQNDDDFDIGKESFMSKQRQIALSCGSDPLADPLEFCPKIKKAVDFILKEKGSKHLVYSSFVKQGIELVAKALTNAGWFNVKSVAANFDESNQYRVFAIWDGKTKDADKQKIKSICNSSDNKYGKYVRVVLGSPSMKEGVSFKHIQHMHILDPLWNPTGMTQVEGRAIRFCSHSDMPQRKRKVHVHLYKAMPSGGKVVKTCDQIIYDSILPSKQREIRIGEHALRSIALDKPLFKDLYDEKDDLVDQYNVPLTAEDVFKFKASSCPRKRRPNPFTEECPVKTPFMRLNPKKDICCYAKPEKK
jgi:hypothetical protein